MNTETLKITERYDRRKTTDHVKKKMSNFYFSHFAQAERELRYTEIITKRFTNLDNIRLLEIGAGMGGNLYFFKRLGLKWENLYANELLHDRFQILKSTFPNVHLYEGDACEIDHDPNILFDIVFQSTVFTSILDHNFKEALANKMWSLVKPGGIILWYDFAFNNPSNKDVKGVHKEEVARLFGDAKKLKFYKVTLAPPIGRRVKKWYPFFNIFPFLRTHLISEIEK
jgi:SAM-dependent methyltransferase